MTTARETPGDPPAGSTGGSGESLLLLGFSAFLIYWNRVFLTDQPLPLADLPGHVALVERLGEQLAQGRLFFYDSAWFSGWPVFEFNGFVSYLLAVAVQFPLRIFTDEPARLAVHLLLVAGCAALPLSMAYAARPLRRQICRDAPAARRRLEVPSAFLICAASFWFLNHDAEWLGIGAGAPMVVGLFTQLIAWHVLLLYLGELFGLLERTTLRNEVRLAVVAACLLCTHLMTAVFALFLGSVSWLWFSGKRFPLLRAHSLALGLGAFWLLPFLYYSADYTLTVVEPPRGDLLELLLRHPVRDLFRVSRDALGGNLFRFDPTNGFFAALLVVSLASPGVRRQPILGPFLLFVPLSFIVFSSSVVVGSIPLGIDYFRFRAYELLLLCLLLSLVPLVLAIRASVDGVGTSRFRLARLLILICSSVSIYAGIQLPYYGRELLRDLDSSVRFQAEREVLEFLRHEPEAGRVLFEYFQDARLFSPITPHDLPSRLWRSAGLETVGGMAIRSSLASGFLAAPAQRLEIPVWGARRLTGEEPRAGGSTEGALDELAAFGVTHAVVTAGPVAEKLRGRLGREATKIGPYRIFRTTNEAAQKVSFIRKPLLGYVDLDGSLPFKMVELYFAGRSELPAAFELVSLEIGGPRPSAIDVILVNADGKKMIRKVVYESALGEAVHRNPPPHLVPLHFNLNAPVDHYQPRRRARSDEARYERVKRYLDRVLDASALRNLVPPPPPPRSDVPPQFHWYSDRQGFRLVGLEPNRMVRVNYSYFPYWGSPDGLVFRGMGERLLFLPHSDTATLYYSRYRSGSVWLGSLLTHLSVLAAGLAWWRGKQE